MVPGVSTVAALADFPPLAFSCSQSTKSLSRIFLRLTAPLSFSREVPRAHEATIVSSSCLNEATNWSLEVEVPR